MLTDNMNECINLLIEGTTKTDIAKRLGVSRASIYNWIDNEHFKEELDRRIQQLSMFGEKIIKTKNETAIEELWDYRLKTTNPKVKADILIYFIDRGIGKMSNKTEVSDLRKATDVDGSVMENEFEQWKTRSDEEE